MHRIPNDLVNAFDPMEGQVLPFGDNLQLIGSQRIAKRDAVGAHRYVSSHCDALRRSIEGLERYVRGKSLFESRG